MPIVALPAVYSMMSNMYGPEEAQRRMAELYGFGESGDGASEVQTERNGWTSKIGRRLSAVAAASIALIS